MLTRVGHCVLPCLMALDIFLTALWLSLLYPFGLARRPTGREMLSTYIGEALYNGMPWAVRMARVVDWAAMKLGDGPDHCLKSYDMYNLMDEYSYPERQYLLKGDY